MVCGRAAPWPRGLPRQHDVPPSTNRRDFIMRRSVASRARRRHFRLSLALALSSACSAAAAGRTSRETWRLPNSDLAGTRAAAGAEIDAGNVARPRAALALPAHGARRRTRASSRRPRSSTAATVYVQDLRSNVFALDRDERQRALEAPLPAPQRRPERARRRRRTRLRRDRLRRLRARRRDRPRALAAPPDERARALRRHRAGRLEGPRLRRAPSATRRSAAARSTRSTPATGAVRWKFDTIAEPWRYPLEAGGGGALVPGLGRRATGGSTPGNSNPRRGAARRSARTAARSPARRSTRTR